MSANIYVPVSRAQRRANIAERLRSGVEIELERITQLELERTTSPSNGGLGVEQAVGGSKTMTLASRPGWSMSWSHGSGSRGYGLGAHGAL